MSSLRVRDLSGHAGALDVPDTERTPSSEGRQGSRHSWEPMPVSSIRLRLRLIETPYGTLDWDGRRAIARMTRSALPYATTADIDAEGIALQRALDGLGTKARLLVDLRAVMPRNDASFEAAIATFRRRVIGGRERAALLVRTAVGALQVKRHMREDGFLAEVFTSEEEALAYLEMRPSERVPCSRRDSQAPRSRSSG